jgi:hypothetical protein
VVRRNEALLSMTLEHTFWLYWVCYIGLWYLRLSERKDFPFRLQMATMAAYAVGTVGMLLFLLRIAVPGAAPIWWLLLLFVVGVTLANNVMWYGVVMRKTYPVPPAVQRAAAVFQCSVESAFQIPCMVMLYRLARDMRLP